MVCDLGLPGFFVPLSLRRKGVFCLLEALVPISCEIIADTLTPISAFAHLRGQGACFLLESAQQGAQWGRFSIIMLNPQGEVTLKDGRASAKGCLKFLGQCTIPEEIIRRALSCYTLTEQEGLPPFCGGVAGYLAYDCLRYREHLPGAPADDMDFSDLHLYLFTQVLVYDHFKHTLRYIRLIPESRYADSTSIREGMEAVLQRIVNSEGTLPSAADVVPYRSESNMSRWDYEEAVRTAKRNIREGDIFQVVLSRRRVFTPAPDAFAVYRRLRSINPSPYMYFLDFGNYQIAGASPECLVRASGNYVETFPIAGTRPRGKTAEEDERLAAELCADEKERAEHAMLVDLGRNDIGRVSRFGSVQVEDYMHVERFSHVMHIVSRVRGEFAPEKDAVDAVFNCLPAGTVSGAPKLRAMEIIDALEPTRRGPYAGAVGYFDFRGHMDTCITLRTLLFKDGKAIAQAGAGIVADSVPDKEYLESESKLRALTQALGLKEAAL